MHASHLPHPSAQEADLKKQDEGDEDAIDIMNPETNELNHVPDADDDDDELLFLPTVPKVEGSQPANGAGPSEEGGGGGDDGAGKAAGKKRKAGQ